MGFARSVLLVALFAVVAPAPSPAADETVRCKTAIVNRGTTLFNAMADLTANCRRRQLRTADLSENCPDTRGFERIAQFTTVATDVIAGACGPNPQTVTCLDHATLEALTMPTAVIRIGTVAARGAKLRCLDTIGRQAIRFAAFKARLLAQCNESVARGVAGYGPAGPACDGPLGAQARIAAAHARLTTQLGRACGGTDGVAGTVDDLDPQTDLGFGATCPGRPYCESPIDTLPDLITCAGCVADEEVGQLSRGLAALPLAAPTACDVGRGHAVLTLLEENVRDLAACEDRILDGNEVFCPNPETFDDLMLSAARYGARVVAACGTFVGPPDTQLTDLARDLVAALYPLHAEEPDNVRKRCTVEIASSATSTSGYARRKLRQLRICHTQGLCGQTPGPCPDSEASASILQSAISAAADIHSRCDAYTPSTLGYGPTCPSNGACGALPTTTIAELITCLQCVGDEVVDAGLAVSY